jgi:hypothetical protein
MNRGLGACVSVAVLFAMMVGVTIAAYFSLIIPEYRNQAFYVGLTSSCVAEFVFFGSLLYAILSPASPSTPDTATRVRLTCLMAIWLVVILVTSGMAVAPKYADTFVSDKLLIIQLAISFLFFMGLVFQHRQSVVVQTRNEPVQRERVRLDAYAGGVDVILSELQRTAERYPAEAVEFDRLLKRLDTLKTQLQSSSGTTLRDAGRPCETIPVEQIERSLRELKQQVQQVSEASAETLAQRLADARDVTDRTLALLKRREDVLTF